MNVLGLIPARGGSKGIASKNIAPLAGRPLLAYTCEAARSARTLTRTAVSTDDEQIARVGGEHGVAAPFRRPAELATDSARSIDAAVHAVEWLAANEAWKTDVLVLLQPTSPLRTGVHIDEALQLFVESGADSLVSVSPVPHQYSPYLVLEKKGAFVQFFWKDALPFDRFHRQSHPPLYATNGPAILITRADVLLQRHDFYGERTAAYPMDAESSIDIDGPLDLLLAEAVLRRRAAS